MQKFGNHRIRFTHGHCQRLHKIRLTGVKISTVHVEIPVIVVELARDSLNGLKRR